MSLINDKKPFKGNYFEFFNKLCTWFNPVNRNALICICLLVKDRFIYTFLLLLKDMYMYISSKN